MNEEEVFYTMALIRLQRVGLISARLLWETIGSATAIFQKPDEIRDRIPQIPEQVITQIKTDKVLLKACYDEIDFVRRNGIQCLLMGDEAYPSRLRECADAPLLLYYKGNADLNALHTLSMVGTRLGTAYGNQLCETFLKDLSGYCKDVLIVSGLAYGIDIFSHRAALQNGLQTVGVLAHGLDRIYPAAHRQTATRMLEQGGLLTEFPSGTNPDRQNFVQRNRIVAGMCDATLVVESASHGGALITADLAFDYGRDCFAFPGRIGDRFSEGCNRLIASNKAQLIEKADDLVKSMGWDVEVVVPEVIQRELFPELSPEESLIARLLTDEKEGLQLNTLVLHSGIPVHKISALLFELEVKGLVRMMAGGIYQWVG